ncbi:MAG: hypothetical protein IT503_17800 [Burkholderiaceae bacterium]|nr:hypothetical protein [Burkholderiaceae bacterium]
MRHSEKAASTIPYRLWGRRLSDALRDAIRTGDLEAARLLCLNGDGQSLGLAKEYSLMFKGLAGTVRVLLAQLSDLPIRAVEASRTESGFDQPRSLIRRFLRAFGASRPAGEPLAVPQENASLADEIGAALRLLDQGSNCFDRQQAATAAEVLAALERGDCERALELVDRKELQEYVPLHDAFIRLMAEAFGWVLSRCGSEELLRFHLRTAEAMRAGFDAWEGMSAREFAWTTAFLLKQHMGQVEVHEAADRYTFHQTLCGSGGRLRRAGAYQGSQALPFVESAGPLTFGRERIPVYCSHCPAWNGVAPLRWYGHPHWVFDDAARPDGGCTLHIYKKPAAVPADYLKQIT